MGYLTSVLSRLLEQGPIEERLAKIEATLCQSKVSPARQSLQAAYGSHLRGQVAPRRRAETPATVEPAVPESLVGQLSRGFSRLCTLQREFCSRRNVKLLHPLEF